ncbi:Importin subunit alpha-9 [Nymphaea thermarum]|nr:Importin subunit alpha-9 [Nymphaea thermarum]
MAPAMRSGKSSNDPGYIRGASLRNAAAGPFSKQWVASRIPLSIVVVPPAISVASMLHSGDQEGSSSTQRREPLKTSVGNIAVQKRRQHAVAVGKERREAAIRTKRLCRDGVLDGTNALSDEDAIMDDEEVVLNAQTSAAVEELKSSRICALRKYEDSEAVV